MCVIYFHKVLPFSIKKLIEINIEKRVTILTVEKFLDILKKSVESFKLEKRHKSTGAENNGFECLVSEILSTYPPILYGSIWEYKCHFGHHFPDITLFINGIKYGVELKSTKKNGYKINGGSVFESTSEPGYEEIFLFFGTLNSKQDEYYKVRFMPYWQALEGIKVTHSPRYWIDMDTPHSLFKSSSDYEMIRQGTKEVKNLFIQEELRKTAEGKWYAPPEQKEQLSPIAFNSLSSSGKFQLISEALILFPFDLLKPKSVYDKINEYFLSQYFIFNSSLRDSFSAGGKFIYGSVKFPRVISTFRKHKQEIEKILKNPNSSFFESCKIHWDIPPENKESLFNTYCENLDLLGTIYLNEELEILHKTLSQIIFE